MHHKAFGGQAPPEPAEVRLLFNVPDPLDGNEGGEVKEWKVTGDDRKNTHFANKSLPLDVQCPY